VEFAASGAGQIIGLGNGDPNSHEPEKGTQRSLFNGLAQLIVQSKAGSNGALLLRAQAPGMKAAELSVVVKPVVAPPAVPLSHAINLLQSWRISPPSMTRPDPNQVLASNDMNSWGWSELPIMQQADANKWRLYRTTFTARQDFANGNGRLIFKQIIGKAEVWIDGQLLGAKHTDEPAALEVALPAGPVQRTLTLVLEASDNKSSGIAGLVVLQANDTQQ
jgi:beta-galactosidase